MWRPPDPLDAVVVWRDQAEHVAEALSKASRVVVLGKLQQRRPWHRPNPRAEVVRQLRVDLPIAAPACSGRHVVLGDRR
jgi:hypothetical protein